ncbi:MAG: DEAD/DEAH box helicase [Micromonosporaceae bacterium]
MLIVHAVWRGERPLLWAEDATLAAETWRTAAERRSSASAGAGAPHRGRRPPHPYAASATVLADALGVPADGATAVDLRLPTVAGVPVGSPELSREVSAPDGRPRLRRWRVPALEATPEQALELSARLADRPPGNGATGPPGDGATAPSGGVEPGTTVRHLVTLAEFATDLVRRGRLLPSVDPPRRRAVWRPLLTGPDAAWAEALTLALPPAGRCADDRGAAEVTATALDALTDAAARAALGAVPLGGELPGLVGEWLRALVGRRGTVRATPDRLQELADELTAWQREATGGAVRACFRLREPEAPTGDGHGSAQGSGAACAPAGSDGEWTVEFALQAVDEPSLVVDADQVWRADDGLRALTRLVAAPQEALLAELGRASRLYPPLEAALRVARPTALRLDTAGVHDFLVRGAPVLAAAGFGVLLPSWWTRPAARLGAQAVARTTATQPGQVGTPTGVGREALVRFEWRLALGDEPLTAAELEELTRLKAPLVRLRGQWVEVDPKRIAAGLAALRAAGPGEVTVADLLRLAAGEHDGPGGLPVTGVRADGWLGDLLSGDADRRLEPAAEPPGFAGTLRPYQRRGLAWLRFLERVGLGGVLADDMGLGKTAQTLALIASDHAGPTLLVCPMSLVGNWQREAARFVPGLRVHVHHGAERTRGPDFAAAVSGADLVITTYGLVARDVDTLRRIDWHRVVVDEAQAIKNAATRQAAAVRSLPARHRLALTGTPVENRLADLWSILEFTNPGLLGPAERFRRRYAEPVERHGDERAASRLRRLTGPLILRRMKTDRRIAPDLPEKFEMEVVCNLTAEQATLYQAVVDDMLARIAGSDGMERRGLVLATMTKLKQVCNHPAHLLGDGSRLAGRSGKLARLEEILEEVLAGGEKALVFTQYAQFGAMLRSHLSARFGREVGWLHGGMPKRARDELVARFQSGRPDAPALMVLSLKAGGTGLNLTAANHVIHLDRWWNPAVEDQATDRVFRIGQRRTVQVRKLVCAGTVEEKVSAMIRDKRALAGKVVGTGEQWLTELSTAQLRELFTLEAGAVVE